MLAGTAKALYRAIFMGTYPNTGCPFKGSLRYCSCKSGLCVVCVVELCKWKR